MSEIVPGDVLDFCPISDRIEPRNGRLHIAIAEESSEHSVLDAVMLLSVSPPDSAMTGITADGRFFAFSEMRPPLSAVDRAGIDRIESLSDIDGISYRGSPGSDIAVRFDRQAVNIMVMNILPGPKVKSFGPAILPGDGEHPHGVGPRGIGLGLPRHTEGLQFFDVPSRIQEEGPSIFTLSWLGDNGIDFVGAIGETSPVRPDTLPLLDALHSRRGSVTRQLSNVDGERIDLRTGDHLRLEFTLSGDVDTPARDYFVIVVGHYEK
jgi:hypothetical protein